MDTSNTPADDQGNRATAARALAQHVVVRAMLATHPEPQRLLALVGQYAEGTRANLLATDWTDEQVQVFETALDRLLAAIPQPSAK